MQVVFDDILFSLQKFGGASVVWNELITRYKNENKHLIYSTAKNNLCVNKDFLQKQKFLNSFFMLVKRYFNPRITINTPFIFHSSHYRYCNNKKAMNITTVHDFTYERYRTDLKSTLHKWQKKRAVMHSDGVICISDNTLNDLRDFYPNYQGEVIVIHNGKSSDYVYDSTVKRKKQALFVGSRINYKRFDFAIDLVSKIEDMKLCIVGGGKLLEIEQQLLNKKIASRYEYYDFVTNGKLNELYNSSLCLLYVSDYEGFGIPIVEAQACGCPVVCQKLSSIPEVAGDCAIFVNSNDNIKISTDKIRKLLNTEYFKKLSDASIKNSQRFSWDKCAQQTFQFYNSIYEKKLNIR